MDSILDAQAIQTQLTDIWTAFINYVPSLLAGILILLIGRWIAKIVHGLLLRLGERIGFDDLIDGTGLTQGLRQADVKQTPTEIVALLVYWLIYLNVILMVLDTLRWSVIADPLRNLIAFLPQVLVVLVIIVAGSLLAQFVGQIVQAAVAGMGIDFHETVGQMVRALLMIAVIIMALQQIGLDVTLFTNLVTNAITIIVAGLALAFGIGGRHIARNVLAGFYARDMFAIGDEVAVDGNNGVLIGIGTINSEIAVAEDRVVIPNTMLTDTIVRVQDNLINE